MELWSIIATKSLLAVHDFNKKKQTHTYIHSFSHLGPFYFMIYTKNPQTLLAHPIFIVEIYK